MPDSTDAVVTALCAGCGEPVPDIGRKRLFFNSPGVVVHDSDACVKLRNDKLDARRAQMAAGPELYEALKEAVALHFMFAPTPRGEAWLKAASAALSKAKASVGGGHG